MPKYSKEKLWSLYQELPKKLKEIIFSEETANSIKQACLNVNLDKEKTIKVAENTGYVLMGLLYPESFQKNLIEEIGIEKNKAKRIFQEINNSIFFPVKDFLEKMYKTEIKKYASVKKEKQKRQETAEDPYLEPIN